MHTNEKRQTVNKCDDQGWCRAYYPEYERCEHVSLTSDGFCATENSLCECLNPLARQRSGVVRPISGEGEACDAFR